MKDFLFTVFFIFAAIQMASAQRIEMEKGTFDNTRFFQNGKRLSLNELEGKLKEKGNEEAYELLRSARSRRAVASIFGYPGAFIVGYNIGAQLTGGRPSLAVGLIGVSALIVSVPIYISANKKIEKAINIYNTDAGSSGYNFQPGFEFIANGNGVGFSMNF